MICPIMNLTKKLVSCPSISPIDFGCQEIIINRLIKIGFEIERININKTSNFFAWKGNINSKTLLFLGHTDVVNPGDKNKWLFPPFEPHIDKNGYLFGRGVVDMKGAIASFIIATENFIKKYPNHKNRIAFLITSDEEADGLDGTIKVVNKLIKRKEKIDYCLIGEPTSNSILGDNIKNGRRGSLNIDLIIYGIQSHVAYPNLNNPIHNIIPVLEKLKNNIWDRGNNFFPQTSMQITNFDTYNKSNNVIPGKCFIQINFRFSNEISDEKIKQIFLNTLSKYKISFDITCKTSGHPFITKKGKLLDVVVSSIQKIQKITPKISTDGGTSDGRFIVNIKKEIQVIEFGLINKTIHKINECVKLSDLKLLNLIYFKILKKMLL